MAANPLTILVGLVLLFFAPGFFLLHALFPGRRYFGPFHPVALPTLSIVASVGIDIVVGGVLAFLPGGPGGDAKGWFQGSQTGAPILELTLGGVALALFAAAWWRGAFALIPSPRSPGGRGALPRAKRRAEYAGWNERGEPEEVTILRDLRLEEDRLRREATRVRRRARESRDAGVRTALTEAATQLEDERKEIATKARDLERSAGERRYGQSAIKKARWPLRSK